MRVFGIKALTVAAVVTVASLVVTSRLPIAADGLPGYCCVCTGCSAGASRQSKSRY